MKDRYYEEELRYLLDAGKAFSKAHPERARYLNIDNVRTRDPHVERLLESFAFLSGRIRRRLDDDLPELSQSLMALLWPHYLRPVPSAAILQFMPVEGMVEATQTIPRGMEIDSDPAAGGAPCRFCTSYDVKIQPITLLKAGFISGSGDAASLELEFKIESGVDLGKLDLSRLRLYLHGDPGTAFSAYRLLRREVDSILLWAGSAGSDAPPLHNNVEVKMAGFGAEEELVPFPDQSFPGYRLMQEYFYFPEKFLFADICNLDALAEMGTLSEFRVEIILKSSAPSGLRLSKDNFRLYCTPIVNLFTRDSEPIRLTRLKTEYPVVVDFASEEKNFEVFSVDSVEGMAQQTGERLTYKPFLSFGHGSYSSDSNSTAETFYNISRKISPWGGWDTFISFVPKNGNEADIEAASVSLELTCTNAALGKDLLIGEIRHPTKGVPEFVRFSNITRPTDPIWPTLGEALEWQFISHLALNFLSLSSAEALQDILEIYDFGKTEANRRRIGGIRRVSSSPKEILRHGASIRGTALVLDLDETHFADEGDVELFSSVLSEFFGLYSSINSFTQLTTNCIKSGTTSQWPPTTGKQVIL